MSWTKRKNVERQNFKKLERKYSLFLKNHPESFNSVLIENLIQTPVTVGVNCWGKRHKLTLMTDGRFALHDHEHHNDPLADIMALGGGKTRCLEVIDLWKKAIRYPYEDVPRNLPKGLWEAVEFHRNVHKARDNYYSKKNNIDRLTTPIAERCDDTKNRVIQEYVKWVLDGQDLAYRYYYKVLEDVLEIDKIAEYLTNLNRRNFISNVCKIGMLKNTYVVHEGRSNKKCGAIEPCFVRLAYPFFEGGKDAHLVSYFRLRAKAKGHTRHVSGYFHECPFMGVARKGERLGGGEKRKWLITDLSDWRKRQ